MAQAPEKTRVEVEPRTDRGKNACRRVRAAGLLPANVYGLNLPPYSISVNARRINEVLHLGTGQNTMITLQVTGQAQSRVVMIRELQRDPVTSRVTHVDFVRVDPTRKVQVSVPIRLLGIPTGVKNEGGILDFVLREAHVECLPTAIPEHLDVDVSGLHLNQHVSVEDLKAVLTELEILDDPQVIIATVSLAAEEVAPVAAEAQAEPEVVGEAKADADKDSTKDKDK